MRLEVERGNTAGAHSKNDAHMQHTLGLRSEPHKPRAARGGRESEATNREGKRGAIEAGEFCFENPQSDARAYQHAGHR